MDDEAFNNFVEKTLHILETTGKMYSIRRNYKFIDWLKSKKELCIASNSVFFDAKLWYRCFYIRQQLEKDNDFVCVLLARAGKGKSTLLSQMCAVISPQYKLDYVCYNYNDFRKALKHHNKFDTYHLDEGALIINSMERGKKAQALDKLSAIMRQFNLFIGICFIDFLQMKRHFRDARINNIIYVPERGDYVYLTEDAVDDLKDWIASKKGNIGNITYRRGTFFKGNFNKSIPIINDICEASYLDKKHKNANQFMQDLPDDEAVVEAVNPEQPIEKYYTARKVATLIGVTQYRVLQLIEDKVIKAYRFQGDNSWSIPETEVNILREQRGIRTI